MAKRVRIELDRKGVRQLLNSREVAADLERRAQRIADAAGPGMEATAAWSGFDRVHVTVRTADFEGRKREATERALTRAVQAGR